MKLKKLMEIIGNEEPVTLWDTETSEVYHPDTSNEIVSEFLQYEVLYVSFNNAGLEDESPIITIRRSENEPEEEDKESFIKGLGELLHKCSCRISIAKIDYIKEQGSEFALITFSSGNQMKKNITGDSCIAIMHDIYKALS